MKKDLIKLVNNISLLSDDSIKTELIRIIHEEYKSDMLPLFLRMQQLDKEEQERKNKALYGGLEDAMHNMSSLGKNLLKGDPTKTKENVKTIFNGDNIAYLIRVVMAYFPKGVSDGASTNGKWVFDKFVEMVKNNKHLYQEGGKDRRWLESMGYDKYVDLILEKY